MNNEKEILFMKRLFFRLKLAINSKISPAFRLFSDTVKFFP